MAKKKVETRGRKELPANEKTETVRLGIKVKIIKGYGKKRLQTELKRHSETLDYKGKSKIV